MHEPLGIPSYDIFLVREKRTCGQSESQSVRAILADDLHRIDNITDALTHLPALPVPHLKQPSQRSALQNRTPPLERLINHHCRALHHQIENRHNHCKIEHHQIKILSNFSGLRIIRLELTPPYTHSLQIGAAASATDALLNNLYFM